MKYLFAFLFLASSFAIKAQIPIIQSNVTDDFKNKSLVYNAFKGKYDFLIAYSISGGWRSTNTNYIRILADKKNSWKKILFSYPDGEPTKQTIKKYSLDKSKAYKLLQDLGHQSFWTLSNDSLNMSHLKPQTPVANFSRNDTLFIIAMPPPSHGITLDGSAYYFEILQGNSLRSYATQHLEINVKFLAEIKSRSRFIKSKNAFENAFK